MQDLEVHAVPVPGLARDAAGGAAQGLQRMAVFQRAEERGLRLHAQNGGGAARVVVVAMTQHQHGHALVPGAQQRHQHPLARIGLAAVAGTGVVHQRVRRGAHQHCIALADVGGQQLELARRRPGCLPKQDRQQQRGAQQARAPGPGHGQQHAPQHAGGAGPHRRRRRRPGGQRQGRQHLQAGRPCIHRPGGRRPDPGQQHAGHGQRRHDQRHPGDGDQVGEQAHHRDLAEQQQRQRRERDGDHPLLVQQAAQRAPGAVPARPGLRLGRRLAPGGEQHAHGHETEPEAGLHQRPGIDGHHRGAGKQPDLGPGPAARAQAQQRDAGKHPDRALGGHAPAAEHRIGGGERQAACQCGMLRGPGEAQRGTAAPEPAHDESRRPGEHGHVQARDAHEVRDAGGAEDVPVGAFDGALVAHDQRGQHAGQPLVRHPRIQGRAHRLPQLLDGVRPAAREQPRRCIARAGADVAGRLQVLLPQPQLVVEAVRIDLAVRRLQADRELPAFARPQFRRRRLRAFTGHTSQAAPAAAA